MVGNFSGYGLNETLSFLSSCLAEGNMHGSAGMKTSKTSVEVVDKKASTLFEGRPELTMLYVHGPSV